MCGSVHFGRRDLNFSFWLLFPNFLCQIAGLTDVSLQSVKDFLFDEELLVLVTGRSFAQFFIFIVAIVPIYLFAIFLYPTVREVLPSSSEYHTTLLGINIIHNPTNDIFLIIEFKMVCN